MIESTLQPCVPVGWMYLVPRHRDLAERVRLMATESTHDPQTPTGMRKRQAAGLNRSEYEQLAAFRYSLRQFERHTELEARKVGLTPQQYQLLLAIKGFPDRDWANISEIAERLQIRHNAVIGLVNRAEANKLVVRVQDADRADRRVVQIHLTPAGDAVLTRLAEALRGERQRVRATIEALER